MTKKVVELMKQIKLTKSMKHLIWKSIIHFGITWAALAFSYNSYREYIRSIYHLALSTELKEAIKATFPWGAMIFAVLYILYGIGFKKNHYPTFKQYVILVFLYTFFINTLFFHGGTDILIVINISILYLILLLLIYGTLKRFIHIDTSGWAEEIFPPVIYSATKRKLPKIKEYFKAKPSFPFIIGFMVLLIVCALLLIFEQEKMAEQLANIAYFLLVIGVGIEVYRLIKYGEEK